MIHIIKNFLFTVTLNSALFLMLIIGIQNSTSKHKVNLLFGETISLPISFILGVSFITGSITGSMTVSNLIYKDDSF